jgi:hypothetical protein
MDLLGVSDVDRRHYNHMSEAELKFLCALMNLEEWYTSNDILKTGGQLETLVRRLVEEIDSRWLKDGKGRAVDFKHTLQVLQSYTAYQAWINMCMKAEGKILDMIVPYWMERRSSVEESAGFLRLKIVARDGLVRKIGDLVWDDCRITILNLKVAGNLDTQEKFFSDPFLFLCDDLYSLRSIGGGFPAQWFESIARCHFKGIDSVEEPRKWNNTKPPKIHFSPAMKIGLLTENNFSFSYSAPGVMDMRGFLQDLAKELSQIRIPGSAGISFQVSDDLTDISVVPDQSETNQPVLVRVLDRNIN